MSAPKYTEKEVGDLLKSCGETLLTLALLPFSLAWSAFVYTKLWGWAAPVMGLPLIGIGTFGVLACLWGAWSVRPATHENSAKRRSALVQLFEGSLARAMALGIGYAFHVWGAR